MSNLPISRNVFTAPSLYRSSSEDFCRANFNLQKREYQISKLLKRKLDLPTIFQCFLQWFFIVAPVLS
eukprot:m.205632 g.205632  ORF g.205632 m.205632 type:complete len:68 (+) comp39661_c0_seq17:56-259(+)